MKLPSSPRISAVIISRNEGKRLRRTVENLADTLPPNNEIVVVDDGSDDDSAAFLKRKRSGPRLLRTTGVGSARARNLGTRHTTGDVIVSLDAHMRFTRDWWKPLVDVLRQPRAGSAAPAVGSTQTPRVFGYGFTLPEADLAPEWLKPKSTSPFHALVLPGCCRMMTRHAFEKTGGYDEGLKARGGVDAETAIRYWLFGLENWIVPESKVWHYFRSEPPFTVAHADVLHNRLRTAMVHFTGARIGRVLHALRSEQHLGDALLLAAAGGAADRRRQLLAQRIKNDDWLFEKFAIRW
jgi:glycosyltransferase involved in cell wall biosynthesis